MPTLQTADVQVAYELDAYYAVDSLSYYINNVSSTNRVALILAYFICDHYDSLLLYVPTNYAKQPSGRNTYASPATDEASKGYPLSQDVEGKTVITAAYYKVITIASDIYNSVDFTEQYEHYTRANKGKAKDRTPSASTTSTEQIATSRLLRKTARRSQNRRVDDAILEETKYEYDYYLRSVSAPTLDEFTLAQYAYLQVELSTTITKEINTTTTSVAKEATYLRV